MVSVVIPAFNEEHRISTTLSSIAAYMRDRPNLILEIIIVDDGSIDGTSSVVQTFCATHSQFSLIHLPKNLGKGASIRAGMSAARGSAVLFMDADGSVSISELGRMMPYLSSAGAVIASRRVKESIIEVKQPFARRWVSYVGGFFRRTLFLSDIRDTQCGFKLFSREAVDLILKDSIVPGYAFDVEALYILQLHNLGIREIGVSWSHGDKGAFTLGRGSIEIFFDLLRIKFRKYDTKMRQ